RLGCLLATRRWLRLLATRRRLRFLLSCRRWFHFNKRRCPAQLEELLRSAGPEHVHQARYDARPPGLMTRAQTRAVIAVEVFVEEDQVAPVRILLKLPRAPVNRAAALIVSLEDGAEPARDLLGHLVQI